MRPPCVTHVCMCACADVCAHTCVCIRRKHHVKDFRYLLIGILFIFTRICFDFRHVGLFLCFFVHRWCGVVWSIESRNLIAIVDLHLSDASGASNQMAKIKIDEMHLERQIKIKRRF